MTTIANADKSAPHQPPAEQLFDTVRTSPITSFAAGASPTEVATRAGHTSVVTVLDRYGHLLPKSEDTVTAALEAMAERAASSTGGRIIRLSAPSHTP